MTFSFFHRLRISLVGLLLALSMLSPLSLFSVHELRAQFSSRPQSGQSSEPVMTELPSITSPTSQSASGSAAMFPTDNVVVPSLYLIGPGDVLSVQIVGVLSGEYPLVVSPENLILLPRFGEVSLQGKTLAEAKAEVQRLVQTRNPQTKAFLTLQRARMVYVRVGGNVAAPGLYTLPASMKVSTAVQLANQAGSGAGAGGSSNRTQASQPPSNRNDAGIEGLSGMIDGKRQFIASFASRATQVRHRNGSVEISDILRANLLDDASADPTLREGDEIYVPADNESAGVVSIAGAVQRPSVIPWRKGDKLSFLLKAAYSLSETADSAAIVVTTGVSAGGSGTTTVRYADVMSGGASSIAGSAASGAADRELTVGTSVVVKENTILPRKQETVVVVGEVKNPGVYALGTEAGKRLRDIIASAGGFSKDAHLAGSYITRRDLMGFAGQGFNGSNTNTQSEAYRTIQYSTLTAEDTSRYNLDASLRQPRVACDFVAAFEQPLGQSGDEKNNEKNNENNVILNDGDIVVVARNPRNVFVFGQVAKPGYIELNELTAETSAEAFIRKAGGYAAGADTSKARVIRSGSRLWVGTKNAQGAPVLLRAGDQIYVPRVADSLSDVGLRKAQLALQKQSNDLQESNRIWTIIGTIFGVFTGLVTAVSFAITAGLIRIP